MKTLLTARRATALGAAAALLFAAPLLAQENFPTRPIRIILPYGPGTSVDAAARSIESRLSAVWKQSIVIDNRPGANGIVAAQAVTGAPADGYTVFVGAVATMAVNPFIYDKLPYDPVKDFVPLGGIFTSPYVLVANASVPATSVATLIEQARKAPGSITYASYGVGSGSHIAAALFSTMTNVKLTHVPYKTNSIMGLMAGDVAISFEPINVAAPHIKAGKVKAFGVTGKSSIPALPDIAPIAPVVPGYESTSWVGLFVPAGTPPAVVSKFSRELERVVARPDINTEFTANGLGPWPANSSTVAEVMKADLVKHKALIERLGIKLE